MHSRSLGPLAAAIVLLPAACIVLFAGCGGGGVTGPTGSVSGLILDATSTTTGIGGAYVYIPAAPPGSVRARASGVVASAVSDSTGHFLMENVPVGRYTLFARPDATPGYAQTGIPVDVTVGASTAQDITVVPQSIADSVARIALTPRVGLLPIDMTLTFSYTFYDGAGVPVTTSATPTWSATGGIGTIGLTGTFLATAMGSGTVTCALGPHSGTAAVTVGAGGQT